MNEHVLVTEQIVREVKRNRVNVAVHFLSQSWKQEPQRYAVPAHLLSMNKDDIEKLIKKVDDFNAKSKAMCINLSDAITRTVTDIANGSDPTTAALAKLFAMPVK